jgi:hypothetical protein
LDKIIPDKPPKVNKNIKPKLQIYKGFITQKSVNKVKSQEKTFIPVGIAIISVAEAK